MSSPHSPRLADELAALGDAAVRVAEDSLFAYAEPCDGSRTAALIHARPPADPWLTASIAFSGPFEGVVRLSLPRAVCADLAGAFCGLPGASVGAAQLADFAGELANMVCGSWLTQVHRTEGFALTAPVVAETTAGHAAASAAAPDVLGLLLRDTPVLLSLAAGRLAVSS